MCLEESRELLYDGMTPKWPVAVWDDVGGSDSEAKDQSPS